jgi:uncharacterized low-complexity protein
MSKKPVINPLTVALGTVFTVSLANTPVTDAAADPFGMAPLTSGYATLAEGKCGEGKCGAAMMGADAGSAEGKCGLHRMDADGDGNVSKDEFMQGHEMMFEKIDQNSDGMIDQAERDEHMGKMMKLMQEGKCGAGKAGGADK